MTDEFINKHDVLQLIDSVWQKWDVQTLDQFYDELREAVIVMPFIKLKVYQCRDCEHYLIDDNIPQEERFVCELDGNRWNTNSFCSYGEKRK